MLADPPVVADREEEILVAGGKSLDGDEEVVDGVVGDVEDVDVDEGDGGGGTSEMRKRKKALSLLLISP